MQDATQHRFSPSQRHHLTGFAALWLAVLVWLFTPAGARAETVHVIAVGDNLSQIARQYNIAPMDLAAYNQIMDLNHVVIGQKIRIPDADELAATQTSLPAPVTDPVSAALPGSGGYHVVLQGESLSSIGRRYDIPMDDLLRLNGMTDANRVLIGQMLRLTARVEAAAPLGAKAPAPADTIYVVQVGDTLSSIAKQHNTTVEQLMRANGLPNAGFVYQGQRLRIQTPAAAASAFGVADAPADGERYILIDLGDQTLTAYQGDVVVLHTYVSTGKASTPTVPGTFAVYLKYDSQRMTGDGYDLPGVPWVMYYDRDFAIHGAYWHANFGIPTSHGCTNMRIDEAKALYEWAPQGTRVVVQY